MEKSPLTRTTASILVFASKELRQLTADLHANGMKVKAQEDLVGALVLAARRAAIDSVKADVEAYWVREAAIAAGQGTAVADDDGV